MNREFIYFDNEIGPRVILTLPWSYITRVILTLPWDYIHVYDHSSQVVSDLRWAFTGPLVLWLNASKHVT